MKPSPKRVREAIYEVLDNQLSSAETPEVKEHHDRLLGMGIAEAEVRRMLAAGLAAYIFHTLKKQEFSYADYISHLSRLPDSETERFADYTEDSDLAIDPIRPTLRPLTSSKMNTTDLMKDPFFVPILHAIESPIAVRDREARARNLTLNDSQVRSILNKVRKKAEGGAPKVLADSDRDKVLAALYDDLVEARGDIQVEDEDGTATALPARDWILALRSVEDSIRLRSSGSGSREYLNFLDVFIKGDEVK